jgi:UDP-N-acetylmuramoylalanine--D-glutamate ligase
LAEHGARVVVNDKRSAEKLALSMQDLADLPIEYMLGSHPSELIEDIDMLCLSGGVSVDLPLAIEARRRGIPLSNDSQIFLEACPAPIVGITGSAGKSTTTSLTGRII